MRQSEYTAPEDFECVLEIQTKTDVHCVNIDNKRVENLWKYKGDTNGM